MRQGWKIAALLFGSGFCALIYQIAWLREFRLIFGASTAASAAVVAIFIGGLGWGGIAIGKRADRHPQPLLLYSALETGVALSAAVSPFLLLLAREIYLRIGGTEALGLLLGTVLRLLLAALVLALPTVLMGGTLPAAARAAETDEDPGRRGVALLYGINTLGAVAGCLLATFWMLETFGDRLTLWLAVGINLVIAITARSVSRSLARAEPERSSEFPEAAIAPRSFVLAAAAIVGFAFFLMELVWYRMLGPLLGGTIFTFGLILAVALLGVGLGGTFSSLLLRGRRPTLASFAYTCLLESLAVAFPFALGDRVAVLANLLRPLGSWGFGGDVLAWTLVTLLVVSPAAFAAGVQFPILIALLGRGQKQVGADVGLTYACNTAGAVVGSIAGGFGLLPLLTAPGCWKLVAALLLTLGAAAVLLSAGREGRIVRLLAPAAGSLLVVLLLTATGPTPVWRHSQIGVGLVPLASVATATARTDWSHRVRRTVFWEAEGVESSVALEAMEGLAFVINGKIDGNAINDAGTQIMGGLIGAFLHPDPRRALVIGLGTGSSAGWLATVPSITRVDVVELEPAILHVAQACRDVNRGALENPKVHVVIGDAREILLTTRGRYDVIFSEPSNPYRAGISSLFTRDYYRAIAKRLQRDGVFVQWIQAYSVNGDTIRTIYATLKSVFPSVETWQLLPQDLALVASDRPTVYSVPQLRQRLKAEPYNTAVGDAWRTSGLEGFFSHFLARDSLARDVAKAEGDLLNTDDRNRVEFGFARALTLDGQFQVRDLLHTSRLRGEDRPLISGGDVDWSRVEDERLSSQTLAGHRPAVEADLSADQQHRARSQGLYLAGDYRGAIAEWRAQPREPTGPLETGIVAHALAETGDEAALPYLDALKAFQPAEADVLFSRLRLRQQRIAEAADLLERALREHQTDPWPWTRILRTGLASAPEIARQNPAAGARLFSVLQLPFAGFSLEEQRKRTLVALAVQDKSLPCLLAVRPMEPFVPWDAGFLAFRRDCDAKIRRDQLQQAEQDLWDYFRQQPAAFSRDLLVPSRNRKQALESR